MSRGRFLGHESTTHFLYMKSSGRPNGRSELLDCGHSRQFLFHVDRPMWLEHFSCLSATHHHDNLSLLKQAAIHSKLKVESAQLFSCVIQRRQSKLKGVRLARTASIAASKPYSCLFFGGIFWKLTILTHA